MKTKTKTKMKFQGRYDVICLDKHGKVKWKDHILNGITTEGLNKILDVMFNDSAQILAASWFAGLIKDDNFSALAAADTMASHAGWEEGGDGGVSDLYDETTRPLWGNGAAAAGVVTNAAAIAYTINATEVVKGMFITSNSVKGGTTGVLWSTGLFSQGDKNVANGDSLQVTYTVTATDA